MEEREKDDEEFMGIKLNLVGKSRRGIYTPPPIWKTFKSHSVQPQKDDGKNLNFDDGNYYFYNIGCNSSVTARQLGANLWQILPHVDCIHKMNRHYNKGSFGMEKIQGLDDDDDDAPSDDQPGSTGSFHRQIAASLIRYHRAVDRNGRALQPVSPASYSSSMEITPYNNNHAASTSSSLEYKGKMVNPSHNLKTSTELLKVLNRIWCLEEQHSSNISVTKALKTELDNARSKIKELLREKQVDRQVIDGLMKQVSDHKHVRKNTDQNRLESTRQELEDERKLRKRSESLHRKMSREISEMKSSFSNAINELEREKHARILLEDLCDEFAMGIRGYEQELRRNDKERVEKEEVDSLILHISEAWLDERVQMKMAEEFRKDKDEMGMVVDKLRPEIETFLKARVMDSKSIKRNGLRRRSLESYPLIEATSAPKDVDDESSDSESNCFELNKNNLGGEYPTRSKKANYPENGESHTSTGLQARFEKHMARMMLNKHDSTNQDGLTEENLLDRSKRFGNRGKSNHLLDNLLRNNSLSIEGEKIHLVSDLPDDNDTHGHFLLAGPTSPVKKWDPEISVLSSRWSKGPRENTLKARLLEARLEGRNLQSKGSKGSA